MISQDEIKQIKETTRELLQKMTMENFDIELRPVSDFIKNKFPEAVMDLGINWILNGEGKNKEIKEQANIDTIDLNIKMGDPQVLIGQNGQTLFGLQRILRIILNKKLKKNFYLRLDINDYKNKKIEYLKNLAKESADEVSLTKRKKILPPMPPYERRIVHMELEGRKDIATESQGNGDDRFIVINPR